MDNENELFPKEEELKIKYKSCFPTTTLKEMKDFKELSFNLIKQLEKLGYLETNTLISKVILDSSSGERLINFLRNFSERVLKGNLKIMKNIYQLKFEDFYTQNNNSFDINIKNKDKDLISLFNNNNQSIFFDIKKKSLLLGIINLKDKILERSEYLNEIQSKWKKFSSKITQELNDKDAENEIDCNKLKKFNNNDTSIFSELSSLDRAPKLENCKYFYDQITKINNNIINSEEFIENINFVKEIDSTRLFEYLLIFKFLKFFSNLRIDLFANVNEKNNNKLLNIHANVKEYNENMKLFLMKENKQNDYETENTNINDIINIEAENKKDFNDNDDKKNIETKKIKKKNNLKTLNSFLLNLIENHSNLNDDLDIFIEKLENKFP